jgi:hypothetical protein
VQIILCNLAHKSLLILFENSGDRTAVLSLMHTCDMYKSSTQRHKEEEKSFLYVAIVLVLLHVHESVHQTLESLGTHEYM